MFQHLLVPLDGSACAEQALPLAAQIARSTHASITLLRVVPLPVDYIAYAGGLSGSTEYVEETLNDDNEAAKRYLEHIQQSQLLEGLNVSGDVIVGGITADVVISDAIQEHADLIVMCSHGNTGFKRFVLGSVTRSILRRSPIPVLVLHEEKSANHITTTEGQPFDILVTLDGSPLAEDALLPAAQLSCALSAPLPGEVHLLQVIEPIITGHTNADEQVAQRNQAIIDTTQAYLDKCATQLKNQLDGAPLHTSTTVITSTNVAETLVDIIEESSEHQIPATSAIALATHGRDGLPRMFLGSVTEHIMDHIHKPLLVIHHVNHNQDKKHEQHQSIQKS